MKEMTSRDASLPEWVHNHTKMHTPARTGGHTPGSTGRKAQAWSFDFMASVTIFFLILVVLFFVWEYTAYQNADQMIFNDMENRALNTVDTIIRVKGFPEYWSESDVEIIGLASEENVLNESKIVMLVNMDYDEARRILGISGYNFFFQLLYLNGTQSYSNGTALMTGIDPTGLSNSTAVVPIERYILFDHRVARLSFILWR